MLKWELVDKNKEGAKVNVKVYNQQYIIDYPCTSNTDCTDYVTEFSPGVYKFELYGSSGGSDNGVSSYRNPDGNCISEEIVNLYRGNTKCLNASSVAGSGGYISGIIHLSKPVTSYITIGGNGSVATKNVECDNKPRCFERNLYSPGGYGGGGSTPAHGSVGSGGGQTAVKFIENDLWHRVIVAGSGGGADNGAGYFMSNDDGSGANSTFGFSFGSGEASQLYGSKNENGVHKYSVYSHNSGSGSGWIGGFASHDPDSGSGGGSSWVLSKDVIIPPGKINATDDFFTLIQSREYAFSKLDYLFSNITHQAGIWEGNGRVIISIIQYQICPAYRLLFNLNFLTFMTTSIFSLSK